MSPTYSSDLFDAEWTCVQRYLPQLSTRGRPRTYSLRTSLDASFYMVRTGCAWRHLPSYIPHFAARFHPCDNYEHHALSLATSWFAATTGRYTSITLPLVPGHDDGDSRGFRRKSIISVATSRSSK